MDFGCLWAKQGFSNKCIKVSQEFRMVLGSINLAIAYLTL
jgi:hypothetical protein